jgi:glutamate synthase domain-containing protein 1
MNNRRAHYELNGLSAAREHLRAAYAALETTTPYESVSDAYAEIMRDVSDTTRYANVLAAAMETEMERGIL